MRIHHSIKLLAEQYFKSNFLGSSFPGWGVDHINLYGMSRTHGRQTFTSSTPPLISSSDNSTDMAQTRLRHQKAGLAQMGSPAPVSTFCSWQESCLQVNFKFGLFCEPARRKIPLATVVPVQLYYFCSKEDKNSLSNKTSMRIWNISREKASIAVSCHSQCSETANEKLETQFTAAIAWKEELDCLPSPLRTLLSESALNILPGRMVLGCYRRLIIHHQTPLHYPAV